jgi:hypothetical protein
MTTAYGRSHLWILPLDPEIRTAQISVDVHRYKISIYISCLPDLRVSKGIARMGTVTKGYSWNQSQIRRLDPEISSFQISVHPQQDALGISNVLNCVTI